MRLHQLRGHRVRARSPTPSRSTSTRSPPPGCSCSPAPTGAGQDQRPRRRLLRAVRRRPRRPQRRQAAAHRPGRRRAWRPAVVLEATLAGRRFRIDPLPRLGAAQEARHRHHHRAGVGRDRPSASTAAWVPLVDPARRGRPPGHRACVGHEPHPVHARSRCCRRAGSRPSCGRGPRSGTGCSSSCSAPERFEDVERWLRERRVDAAPRAPSTPPRHGRRPGQPGQRGSDDVRCPTTGRPTRLRSAARVSRG